MKQRMVWEAVDGKRFDSKEDCRDYESSIPEVVEIYRFLDSDRSKYRRGSQRTIAMNAILDFLRFREEEEVAS